MPYNQLHITAFETDSETVNISTEAVKVLSDGSKPVCPIVILRSFQNNIFNSWGVVSSVLSLYHVPPAPPFFKNPLVLQQKGVMQCCGTNGLYRRLYKPRGMQGPGSARRPYIALFLNSL